MTDKIKKQTESEQQSNENEIKLGKYRHYKGKFYEVIGIALHSETLEEFVVYKPLYDNKEFPDKLWIRPKNMFIQTVLVNNQSVKRFEFISNN